MDRFWMDAFKAALGRAERSIVNELLVVRNKLAHNETFTYNDAERALDSMRRLMEAISAGDVADQLGKMRTTPSSAPSSPSLQGTRSARRPSAQTSRSSRWPG